MYTRISAVLKPIGEYVLTPVAKAVANFFVGDIFDLKAAEKRATINPDGVGVMRIGPPLIGCYITHFIPRELTAEEREAFLKKFMMLKNLDARSPFDLGPVTNSTFLPAINTKDALEIRKGLAGYFNLPHFDAKTTEILGDLFTALQKNNEAELKRSPLKIIKEHVNDIFSSALLGFKVPQEVLISLDDLSKIADLVVLTPRFIHNKIPKIKAISENFDTHVKTFLREKLFYLRKKKEKIDPKSNYFNKVIFQKFSYDSWSKLTDENIEDTISDPNVRACITLFLAVFGMAKLISYSLDYLYNPYNLSEETKDLLLKELSSIQKQNKIDRTDLLDTKKMPILHAVYIESLRYASSTSLISRYTKETLHAGTAKIPAKSIVVFDLRRSMCHVAREDKDYGTRFNAFRFLGGDRQLNESAKGFNHGAFLPFGAGTRSCPAAKLVELVYKTVLTNVLLNIDGIYDEQVAFIYKEQSPSSSLLAHTLFHHDEESPRSSSTAEFKRRASLS